MEEILGRGHLPAQNLFTIECRSRTAGSIDTVGELQNNPFMRLTLYTRIGIINKGKKFSILSQSV
ncbi:MAG TPA: hypothetical protein ACFYD6_08910 [Candidatus Brocadiia bacterium]|nr:hypothetical protein [Planctomycetota bacterium]MBI4007664.1 hypothetical protein [Planctomycetota bacterium]MDO8093615.1 hypothetical protein [Candidatus Brocadiales bacterium]